MKVKTEISGATARQYNKYNDGKSQRYKGIIRIYTYTYIESVWFIAYYVYVDLLLEVIKGRRPIDRPNKLLLYLRI
jgi:hypothetical protein